MKRYSIYLFALILVQCTTAPHPDNFNYKVFFQNNSNQEIKILFYNDNDNFLYDSLSSEYIITNGERVLVCEYISEGFGGHVCGTQDQTIIRFPNNKGYYCDQFKDTGKCFESSNRDFTQIISAFEYNGNNEYTFIITQEDYENAHELPE